MSVSFTTDIETLRGVLKNACDAFDENIQPNLKGIYFNVADGFVDIAANAYITSFYRRLTNIQTTGTGVLFIPVTLYSVIESLKDTAFTKIGNVTIEEGDKHVNVYADEYGIEDTDYVGFTQRLQFTIPKNVVRNVEKLDFGIVDRGLPDNVEYIPISEFHLVADMFLPLFGKNDFQSQRSYLFLGEKLFTVNAFMTAYSDNIFSIRDKSINCKLLSYLKSLTSGGDPESSLAIWEQDRRIYCEYNSNYITYNIPKIEHLNISHVLSPNTEEHCVVVPMEMILALFQRSTALSDKNWTFDITDKSIRVFNRELAEMHIPVLKSKDLTGKFIIEVEHLNKALILRDAQYVLLYIYQANNGYRMKVMDNTKLWACDIPIKRAKN